MSKIIGIDLGTTNSVVAIMEGGQPKVLVNEEGARTTPSIVAYKDGEKLVGQIAKRQAVTNPENTIGSAKRFIGRRFSEVAHETKMVSYKVIEKGNDSAFVVKERGVEKNVAPEEVSAAVLGKLKKVAEDYLGEEVTRAVITVPAYFNDAQRQATRDAGRIAGLTVERIINEPTAAALAYGFDKSKEQKIAVYDLGGGTFDVSVLEVGDNVVHVRSTNGDTQLGGDNFDERVLVWLGEEFKKDQGIDLTKDKMALQRLREAAEKAKVELSSALETEINLPFITADASGPKHLQVKLTRAKFDQLTEDLVKRTLEPCRKALADANWTIADIDEIVLVGGSTRIPAVQEAVKAFFKKEPNRSVNPDEVVAVGAAIQGGVLAGDVKDILLLDVTPLSLGIETLGGVATALIDRNTTIPVKKSQVFSTAEDNQSKVEIHVVQGERPMASDNKSLGRFELNGIPPASRGVPQVEVTFDIDASGMLAVSAKDMGTGKVQQIQIKAKSGLTDEEIKRMMREAEANADTDKAKKESISSRNDLDSLVYQAEKMMKENEAKFEAQDMTDAKDAVEASKKVLLNQEAQASELKENFEKLQAMVQKLSASLYKQESAQQPGGQTPPQADDQQPASKGEDNVIDADFKDVN